MTGTSVCTFFSLFVGVLCLAVAETQPLVSEIKHPEGHDVEEDYKLPLPITYIDPRDLPDSFSWSNVDGKSYLTRSLNQHLPHYCGSCWAHGSLSSLADRIKIARNAQGDDINLSIQFVLNCGQKIAGSCHGGSATGLFQFIKEYGLVPYDSCQPYLACSSDSTEGFCPQIDSSCSPINICRTCAGRIGPFFPHCVAIDSFPNATIAEYGVIRHDVNAIKAEIFARGPVAAAVAGRPLAMTYSGGIFRNDTASKETTHIVSIVGWGSTKTAKGDDKDEQYWIIRNSWGQYWGEMGFARVQMGHNIVGIESHVSWATPGIFSETNVPCSESGNCYDATTFAGVYVDPSTNPSAIQRRLKPNTE